MLQVHILLKFATLKTHLYAIGKRLPKPILQYASNTFTTNIFWFWLGTWLPGYVAFVDTLCIYRICTFVFRFDCQPLALVKTPVILKTFLRSRITSCFPFTKVYHLNFPFFYEIYFDSVTYRRAKA